MIVYVAGSSKEISRVKLWLAHLEKFNQREYEKGAPGIQLAHNWVAVIESRGEANPTTASKEQHAIWAGQDLAGVKECDVFWLLFPEQGNYSDGAMYECGYADHAGKEIVISGLDHKRSIFTARGHSCNTDVQGFNRVVELYFASYLNQ